MNYYNNAGIIVESLSLTQQGVFLSIALNELINSNHTIDPILFYEEYDKIPIKLLFCMLQAVEMWHFKGPVIATSIHTAKLLLDSPRPIKKYFYVWNLEWMYSTNHLYYQDLKQIYQNKEIELIARSQEHYDIIHYAWKKPVTIMENFHHEKLIEIFNR